MKTSAYNYSPEKINLKQNIFSPGNIFKIFALSSCYISSFVLFDFDMEWLKLYVNAIFHGKKYKQFKYDYMPY